MPAPQMHPWTLALGSRSRVTSLPGRALRSRERRLESCHAPAIPLGTLAVSDSGSETGAASRVHVWLDAVRCGQLDRAQCSDQRIHPQSGSLFERLLGSGRRGRRFKSGHPDPAHRPVPILELAFIYRPLDHPSPSRWRYSSRRTRFLLDHAAQSMYPDCRRKRILPHLNQTGSGLGQHGRQQ
jgi:hypothetical protein